MLGSWAKLCGAKWIVGKCCFGPAVFAQQCVQTWPAPCSLLGTGHRTSSFKAELSKCFITLHRASC